MYSLKQLYFSPENKKMTDPRTWERMLLLQRIMPSNGSGRGNSTALVLGTVEAIRGPDRKFPHLA